MVHSHGIDQRKQNNPWLSRSPLWKQSASNLAHVHMWLMGQNVSHDWHIMWLCMVKSICDLCKWSLPDAFCRHWRPFQSQMFPGPLSCPSSLAPLWPLSERGISISQNEFLNTVFVNVLFFGIHHITVGIILSAMNLYLWQRIIGQAVGSNTGYSCTVVEMTRLIFVQCSIFSPDQIGFRIAFYPHSFLGDLEKWFTNSNTIFKYIFMTF